jgi:hypothetical protein
MSPEIKLIEKDTDLSKIDEIPWDLELRGVPYTVYRVAEHFHHIGGRWGNNDYWCCPSREKPTYDNLIEFEGSAPCWGIQIEDENFSKKKWNETYVRDSVHCHITRNGKKFYEISGNSFAYCYTKALHDLFLLREHAIPFHFRNWREELLNRKVYYRDDPAFVSRIVEDQGCVILTPEKGVFSIPEHAVGDKEFSHFYEDRDSLKVDYLDPNIWWHRKSGETR